MFPCRHFRGGEREAQLDVEAALRPGVRCDRRAAHAGDGADDGEAQPVSAGMADSPGPAQADAGRWHQLTAVSSGPGRRAVDRPDDHDLRKRRRHSERRHE